MRNEYNNIIANTVIVIIYTIDDANLAESLGCKAVYLYHDKLTGIPNINLINKIKKNTDLIVITSFDCYCSDSFIKLMNKYKVDILDCRFTDIDDVTKYNIHFMTHTSNMIDGMKKILRGIDMVYIEGNNLNDYIDKITLFNKKINEFNKYKNQNSINRFCKAEQIDIDFVNRCTELNRIPVLIFMWNGIKNPIDLAEAIKFNFDGIIVDISLGKNMIKAMVKTIENPCDEDLIIEVCESLF